MDSHAGRGDGQDERDGPSSNGPATTAVFTGLSSYLELGMATVEGWLSPTAACIVARVLIEQVHTGLRGDVCEIGVHHGKLFLVLANAAAPEERAVAVDVFGDQEKNVDRSGCGDRVVFEQNIARYAPGAAVEIMPVSSLTLRETGFLSHRFRFISVDGGHTAPTVSNDLRLAEQTLIRGGVVALDDILSSHWTGVLTGLASYVAAGGSLLPFALIPNKLLLTTDAASADRGRALLRRLFPLASVKRDLEFLSGVVDLYEDHPYYDRGNYADLRLALDDTGRERDTLLTRLGESHGDVSELRRAHDELAVRHEAAEARLARLQVSTSWRMTGPLRGIVDLLKGRRG